ncbi:MAG: ABC transporter ATP-binding protein [Pseudomonadota bacterium]|nr:ABC transporter ATP-binding protein [Pseudomonadota bacterium]
MRALEIVGVNKSFSGFRVINDVNLFVDVGERRLIIGPNGAGKTTLFNIITGEIQPDDGAVLLNGQNITNMPVQKRSHLGLTRTYQIITLFPNDSLLKNISLSLLALSSLRWNPFVALSARNDIKLQALEVLDQVGLKGLADRPLNQTSYGEQRRVEIAMALAQNPKIILLDEPFAGLSIEERTQIRELLVSIPEEVTIVMIDHDMEVALEFAEKITVMHFGEVVVEGSRAEVVEHPKTREIYLGG